LLAVAGLTGISRWKMAVVDIPTVTDSLDAEQVVTLVTRDDGAIICSPEFVVRNARSDSRR